MRLRRRAAGPAARPPDVSGWLDRLRPVCYPLATRGARSAPGAPRMTSQTPEIVRLEFCSAFDMLDFVQLVSDHLCRRVGFDEDSMHWVSVAIRESVINAIKHGNRNDAGKMVHVDFTTSHDPENAGLTISVRDEGEGFEPEEVADP